ncbi:PD-(D/E)XK nuclease family protein [Cochleicola gelatinilyticus]|uniref:PD-(D/E)XK endonuclease-like domain-containing protein n=1 Tax=Cochleicola gelatinilyticus TaxID=1763537 RepID=A0A167J415_9FLAO|nr:PD-(D/E)XK nuclease family protein [Cochleicola gelatinilyticus]OAB80308.1 hypothetical protein ULVI_06115 [Cochleicola gelatinilyticus]
MQTFLEETLAKIQLKHSDLSSLILILPSKRAGGFLKHHLRQNASKTFFAPKILSIEEFIETLSDLSIIDTTELMFKSFESYQATTSITNKDDFETYASWATTLLNDFNEIDRHLVETDSFFNYLTSIKTLERWGVQNEKTQLITSYLTFWENLPDVYENLQLLLLKEKIGYQGLVYRKAAEKVDQYINKSLSSKHIFIGFNALNNAEQQIIQKLLEAGNTEVYWDADAYLYNDTKHGASLFVREYLQTWNYYKKNDLPSFPNNFKKNKDIELIGVQKNIGQAKYVGKLLSELTSEELCKTAIVLADETLLEPLLDSFPSNVSNVNITMGVPIKNFPLTTFFEMLLKLHSLETGVWYYKDVLALLNHPTAKLLLKNGNKILKEINAENTTHISEELLLQICGKEDKMMVSKLFGVWNDRSNTALNICSFLLLQLKSLYEKEPLKKVIAYQLYTVFKKIEALDNKFSHLKTIRTIHSLFRELIATTTLDYAGDAYDGLQVMGVLETRVLDFERVIMTSVNEGILPSGKSNASFITYDLKVAFNLPKYTEKDAIYTYHFYHILHRSKNIKLLYNTFSDGLNTGEKSRFLLQLEINKHENHSLHHKLVTPEIKIEQRTPKTIEKTTGVMNRLQEIAEKGFSPSALTSYIRNPIDFYFQKIIRLSEIEEVEETIAANTMGTIVHDALENLYKPLEGSNFTRDSLKEIRKKATNEVQSQFEKTFPGGNFNTGKNLIIFEVAKRYVTNMIDSDSAQINAGNTIELISVEQEFRVPIIISELPFPTHIRGKIDRIDRYNDQLRIIDYKTGAVQDTDLKISEWESLISDYKYSKAFQVLTYAYMIYEAQGITAMEAGIISFKNLNSGFLKFIDKSVSKSGTSAITAETLELFTFEAKKLILEICDSTIPFIEKEIT